MCSKCNRDVVCHAKGLCPACYQQHRRGTVESARLAHRAANKRYRLTHPNYRASRVAIERLYRYKLTDTDYTALIERQNNLCAICEGPWTKRGPCIDHDHKTGKVRGLLCDDCNKALGFYEKLLSYPRTQPYLINKETL